MDAKDREIIRLLENHARLSFSELAERVHLSANAVTERVKRLTGSGVIRGFHADIDPATLGLPLQAYIEVKLKPETSAAHFEAILASIGGIVEATLQTGSFDYLLRAVCADPDDLTRIIAALRLRAGVQDTNSRLILRRTVLAL